MVFTDKKKDSNLASHYKEMIAKTFQQWRPRIAAAPAKNGWDQVFKTQIPSRREILMARDAVLQDIMLEAKAKEHALFESMKINKEILVWRIVEIN